jgi:anti-anti-sigma regulatory factor
VNREASALKEMQAMSVAPAPYLIAPKATEFSHEHASAISKWVLERETALTIHIDLSHATSATTAAFATLVLLRRRLLRDGRDLRVSGLRERAQHVFQLNRLQSVLPAN